MSQEKFRTLKAWPRCRYITRTILEILEEIPWEKTFSGEFISHQLLMRHMTLPAILCSRNLIDYLDNGNIPNLQRIETGTGKVSTFMFVRPQPVLQQPLLVKSPESSPAYSQPSIHERMAGVEANLMEVLAAQGRAGHTASSINKRLDTIEGLLKRTLAKLGEEV